MGFASLTGALVARKGQARPSPHSQLKNEFEYSAPEGGNIQNDIMDHAPKRQKTSSKLYQTKSGASLQVLETKVRDKFTAPYEHVDLHKMTIRLDRRLFDAFKIQAAMLGCSQQDLFREAIERQLTSTDWLDRVK